MRGSIIERGNSYRLKVSLGKNPVTGKYDCHLETFHGSKRGAQMRLAELTTEINKGVFIRPGKATLADYLKRWLTEYAKPNLSPRSTEGYTTIVTQHLIPKLGNIGLSQLRPEHLQRYYADLLGNGRCDGSGALSALTVRHHHTCLHKALQTAVEWGLLSRNVADAVKPPRFQSKEMKIWDAEQISRFLNTAKRTLYYPLFYLALYTGLRRSELLALRWQDVDLLLAQLSVVRSLHQLRDKSIAYRTPKTAKGKRTVALPPSAVIVLREHWNKQAEIQLQLGLPPLKDTDLIFCHIPDGTPLRPNTITRAWTILAERAGLPVIRLHDARHSHASLLLKQGIHPKIVQERLGHATIAITLDTYSHPYPPDCRKRPHGVLTMLLLTAIMRRSNSRFRIKLVPI